jgi:maltose alpha-D-glucosyltransferase/alpha-amylase
VLKVMRFWLDRGVDGLRLDAVAHLFEREGTTCENLPETHAFLRTLRGETDARYAGRVLLAEANHEPADLRSYFGDGDECHMAFHFPLMPRLFMALKQEDASPVIDIVRQTDGIPASCQWAVFLRNHDELTLSALTSDERDSLSRAYAPDPRMRLNHGIRRRLAPLLDNDRGRLGLAYALLLSLPGSPVLYYGDEIGMGDNIQLEDRDGIRTPMQWNDDAFSGFSTARSAPSVAPLLEDAVYGYRVVNVEKAEQHSESLLHVVRRLIDIRRRFRAFGRGSIDFLETGNPRVLAFARRYESEAVIVIANLAASVQSAGVAIPCAAPGRPLVEMIHGKPCPPLGADPYLLTLDAHACCWFDLAAAGTRATGPSSAFRREIETGAASSSVSPA